MGTAQLALLLFGLLIVLIALGLPLAFAMGGAALIFMLFVPETLTATSTFVLSIQGEGREFVLVAVPLFILMANVLHTSGVARDLYDAIYHWFGPVRGGLASATVVVCAIFAAMCGLSAVGTLTTGLIAIPSMLERGYDKRMATGCVAGGGALGILIPPSLSAIFFGFITGTSIGKLFTAGILPGILMSFLFILYITINSLIYPQAGPPLPREERLSFIENLKLTRALILPMLVITLVLGTIYTGICTPTESAAMGAAGAIICSAVKGTLNWSNFKTALVATFKVTTFVMWICTCAVVFVGISVQVGLDIWLYDLVMGLGLTPFAVVFINMVIIIILGCFLDPTGIMFIVIPIFFPLIVVRLGFDPVWYGILVIIGMEMAYLTPPFGFNLFYLRSIVPEGVTIGDIYRGVIPFVILQFITMVLVMFFPIIPLYLVQWMG